MTKQPKRPTPQDYCNLVARHDLADDSDESKGIPPFTMAVLTFLVGLFWGACGMLIYVKFF